MALDYLRREQTGEYGVHTNRLETDQTGEAASGHEVLSESAGLLMRYYVARGKREEFAEAWLTAKRTFDQPEIFGYRYSPKVDKLYEINAAVDDLRIIRALFEAADIFQSKDYRKEAERYGARFLKRNASGSRLYDFYDTRYHQTNGFLTLCYADFRTLERLEKSSPTAGALSERLLDIVEEGYLSDEFPFYATRYVYESKSYDTDTIQMAESLLTVLHLAEIGAAKERSFDVIRDYVRSGTLYGQYARDGEPRNDVRSTALYAIAAQIGYEIGDRVLYADAMHRMSEFQILEKASPLYGGFGDTSTGQSYSFDNLMALLAHTMNQEADEEGGHSP